MRESMTRPPAQGLQDDEIERSLKELDAAETSVFGHAEDHIVAVEGLHPLAVDCLHAPSRSRALAELGRPLTLLASIDCAVHAL